MGDVHLILSLLCSCSLMAPKNRNLFPLFAVLLSAGLIAGLGGIFLLISDQLDSGARVVSNLDDPDQESSQTSTTEILGSHTATVLSVAAGTTSPMVASGSYDNTVKLWNRNDAEAVRSLAHNGRVNDLIFTTDGRRLTTVSGSGDINLWTVPAGELTKTISGNSGRIISAAMSLDDTVLAIGSGDGAVKTWTLKEDEFINPVTLKAIGPQINAIAFHPIDPNLLLSGDQEGTIRVWDLAQQKNTLTLDNNADRIASLSVNNNGYAASGSYDAAIRIWNMESGKLTQTLKDHDFVVADVAFSPNGKLLASASYDESIKVWDWQKSKVLCTLNGHSGFVYSVVFSDAGDTLISGGYDGTVRTWDLAAAAGGDCLAY